MYRPSMRIILALVIFVVSLAALVWSFLPGTRIVRRQKIQPTEMQMPSTPGSTLSSKFLVDLENFDKVTDLIVFDDRFATLI